VQFLLRHDTFLPFEGEDLLSGEKYHAGEEIALGAYDVLLIKKV
jgi:hypothetical protein